MTITRYTECTIVHSVHLYGTKCTPQLEILIMHTGSASDSFEADGGVMVEGRNTLILGGN